MPAVHDYVHKVMKDYFQQPEVEAIKFKCRNCNGTGRIPNHNFERCTKLTKEEKENTDFTPGDCKKCLFKVVCDYGEEMECPCCDGFGEMTVLIKFWEFDRCLVNTQSDAPFAEKVISRSSEEQLSPNKQ